MCDKETDRKMLTKRRERESKREIGKNDEESEREKTVAVISMWQEISQVIERRERGIE